MVYTISTFILDCKYTFSYAIIIIKSKIVTCFSHINHAPEDEVWIEHLSFFIEKRTIYDCRLIGVLSTVTGISLSKQLIKRQKEMFILFIYFVLLNVELCYKKKSQKLELTGFHNLSRISSITEERENFIT